MEGFVFDVIKRLGMFTIVAQTMIHFCPNSQYEKYIKVLIGIMSVTIVITPFLGLVKNFSQNDFASTIKLWEERLIDTGDNGIVSYLENDLDSVDNEGNFDQSEVMKRELEEELKIKINKEITEEKYIVRTIFIVEETIEDKKEMKKIKITLTKRNEGKVVIEDISITQENVTKKEIEKWTSICSTFLGIDESYLEVEFS